MCCVKQGSGPPVKVTLDENQEITDWLLVVVRGGQGSAGTPGTATHHPLEWLHRAGGGCALSYSDLGQQQSAACSAQPSKFSR